MPGIYVNDGGGISSALGNILGGMANNMGPEAAAKAQLLKLQAEEADRKNALLSNTQRGVLAVQPSLEAAGATGPAAPTDPGIVTTQPATGVAGTLSSVAQPPDPMAPFARDQTRNFSPYAQIVAGSYANNPSMDNFKTGVDLGRNITQGPGHDFATENEIAKQRLLPYDLSTGQTRHFPGLEPGGGGEKVVEGGDAATAAANAKMLEEATSEAKLAFGRGAQAITDQGELRDIVKGYDALINIQENDWGTPAGLELAKAATEATGGKFDFARFSSKQEAIDDLTARLQGMLGSARVAQGDPALRGGIELMLKQLNVAKNTAPSFHRMTDAFGRQLQVLIDEADASKKFLDSGPNAQTAKALRDQIIANRQRAAEELRKGGFSAEGEPAPAAVDGGEGAPPKPSTQPVLKPADPGTVQRARVKLQGAGNDATVRQRIIDAGKANGVDLEAGGF
jgi:hypothetical protein